MLVRERGPGRVISGRRHRLAECLLWVRKQSSEAATGEVLPYVLDCGIRQKTDNADNVFACKADYSPLSYDYTCAGREMHNFVRDAAQKETGEVTDASAPQKHHVGRSGPRHSKDFICGLAF